MSRIHKLTWSLPSSKTEGISSSLISLQEEMNRLFNHLHAGTHMYVSDGGEKKIAAPAINIVESSNSFRVEAELCGIDPKNVNVEVANGFLTIKGERREVAGEEDETYHRREISYGTFVRTLALPDTAEGIKAKASFKNGILTVAMPKKVESLQIVRRLEVGAVAAMI